MTPADIDQSDGEFTFPKVGVTDYLTWVTLGSNQSMGQPYFHDLHLNTVVRDDFSAWDTTNYAFTAPDDGVCLINFQTAWESATAGDELTNAIALNSSTDTGTVKTQAVGGDTDLVLTFLQPATAGDVITAKARDPQTTTTIYAGQYKTYLQIARVA